MAALSQVFFPLNLQELFSTWNHFPNAQPCAGGTGFIHEQGARIPLLPEKTISLDKLEELHKISRSERYLEIGAMVKLNRIIQLGRIVPEALARCIQCIADLHVRNQATIGGNICFPSRKLDVCGPMIALDAQYELRTAHSARWLSASRFSSLPGPPTLGPHELLTRIRVPLEPWTFSRYLKFHTSGSNEPSGGIIFIMRNQKNILTNVRIVYSGQIIVRDKNSETMLAGKVLPLNRRDIKTFLDSWRTCLSSFKGNEKFVFGGDAGNSHPELVKTQVFSFIENMITRLAD